MCLVCVMMNWKETPPLTTEVQSVVQFLTIENNFSAKIHHRLCTVNKQENVMNFRNIQQWQSVFQKGRTNIHDNRHNGCQSIILDETVRCIHTLLKNDRHLLLLTCDERWQQFSYKASKTTIVPALQQLMMQKVCTQWVLC